MKQILLIFIFFASYCAYSQSLSQTSNPNSSLLLGQNIDKEEFIYGKVSNKKENKDFNAYIPSQLTINVATKDKKLTLENIYNFQLKNSNYFITVGINGSGKINNSIASVFQNSNVVGGFSGNLLLGLKLFRIKNEEKIYRTFVEGIQNNEDINDLKRKIGKEGHIVGHWFYINPSLEGREFKNFFPENDFDSQIQKKNESLWAINIGYNYWNPNIFNFNSIFGISFAPKLTDNFSDLTEFTLTEQQSSTNDTIQRVSSSKTTVYQGIYETTHKQDLNFETFLVHNKLPTFGLYAGYLNTFNKDLKPLVTVSTGFYFSKPKQPTNPSIGIIVNFKDIYDNFDIDSGDKFSINLVTRLNIGNAFR